MTIEYFNRLSFRQKAEIVSDHGTLIAAAIDEDIFTCYLYSVGSFFVEAFGYQEVNNVEAYHDSERLDKFLIQVDLGGLV